VDVSLDVDEAFDRLSQVPAPPTDRPSARTTERPADYELQGLRYIARTGIGWLDAPPFAYDEELCCLTLSAPYEASALDDKKNRYVIPCEVGTVIPIPDNVSARTFFESILWRLVEAQLKKTPRATVIPYNQIGQYDITIDDQWLSFIRSSFHNAKKT
jgi:hypothetical protein